MNYMSLPNLPEKPVFRVIIDGRIPESIQKGLHNAGIETIKTKACPSVYDAISHHPDIMLHHLGEEYIVHAPETSEELLEELSNSGFKLIKGNTALEYKYPGNIAYNVARIGNIAFHNVKYTDPILKSELEKRGVELVHVNQGYTKCSVSIVDQKSIITADIPIARAAQEKGIEVLLIEPPENILLHDLKSGFIGGSTGLIAPNKWTIAGDIKKLEACDAIQEFLNERGIEIISLYNGDIIDIGSIIPIMVY